jgi:uncharacterized protein GlcG (DUF336 family)
MMAVHKGVGHYGAPITLGRRCRIEIFHVRGATLIEGGIPIVVDGQIVGGIGVSGVDAKDDAQIAQAGADAVK